MAREFDINKVIQQVMKAQVSLINDPSISAEDLVEMQSMHTNWTILLKTTCPPPNECRYCEIDRMAESIVILEMLGVRVPEELTDEY
jgi:hypothetical protein